MAAPDVEKRNGRDSKMKRFIFYRTASAVHSSAFREHGGAQPAINRCPARIGCEFHRPSKDFLDALAVRPPAKAADMRHGLW